MDGVVEVLALVLLFGWPGILIGMYMLRLQGNERHKRKERAEARKIYERLMHHKLEVVETALAMGYTQTELQQLDVRLAALVGADKMRSLLDKDGLAPALRSQDLTGDAALEAEIRQLRKQRQGA
jgi:hypothetical protein